MTESSDSDVVEAMKCCRRARVTVHVRGTDERPVIEFKDKKTRRIVGGIEMKRRLADVESVC